MNRIEVNSETSRIRAALVNSERFDSFQDAERAIAASTLAVVASDDALTTPAGQAALLTAVATGARCFGNVHVRAEQNRPLLLPLQTALDALTVRDAAIALGARLDQAPAKCRTLVVGPDSTSDDQAVQAFWDGWTAGTTDARLGRGVGRGDCAIAGIAAGALGVGQAFLAEQGDVRAGRTLRHVSLWTGKCDEEELDSGPKLADCALPLELWLFGLGNLGQAHLWSLSLLPYAAPAEVRLVLQDDDRIRKENWGTSILVERGRYGELKTKAAERWAVKRKFDVRRVDRRLDEHQRLREDEPRLALAGLDRMDPRRLLGKPGFMHIVDAGLGATAADYTRFRVNVFDADSDPATHFADVADRTREAAEGLLKLNAYRAAQLELPDGACGAALLAGQSVAVPFVGAFAASLAIAQTIRLASGEAPHIGLTGDLRDLRTVQAALGHQHERTRIPTSRPR